PSTYEISTADPTAEYRLLDNFQLGNVGPLSSESFRTRILERLPVGTPEETVYQYLEERLVSLDRFSSYSRANKRGEIIGRIDYDPTLPGLVKKHFGFVLLLDDDNKLKDVRLNLWVTGP
ncbi:MAG TPA: hypothetical protein VLE20_06875, partial [Blastocatellia bacterium]|nr:hypothetical protein [Blastocatellia bacterium]